jgi:hypothetical protein
MGNYQQRTKNILLRNSLFSVHISKEQDIQGPSNWITSLRECANSCFFEDDAILDIHMNKDQTLLISCKQMMYFFSNSKPVMTRVQFPWKVLSFFQTMDKVYILNEFQIFLVISSPLKNSHSKVSEIDSEDIHFVANEKFPKVDCLAMRDLMMILVTEKNQICVKDDVTDPYAVFEIFQSKRKISKVINYFIFIYQ